MSDKKCNCNEPYDSEKWKGGYPYCPVHDKPLNLAIIGHGEPAHERPAGSNVWVKVVDMLPDKDGYYHVKKTPKKSSETDKDLQYYHSETRRFSWDNVIEWLDESNEQSVEQIEWNSQRIIGRVKDRFKELEEKEWEWRGFYNGWLEGRADMLAETKGLGQYKNMDAISPLTQSRADFIREANGRDLDGVKEEEPNIDELWDEHSEMIDDDIDSLSRWAGSTVVDKEQFRTLVAKLWERLNTKNKTNDDT